MKFAIVLCFIALAAVAMAGPVPGKSTPSPLVRHEEVHSEHGYNVEFELADGTYFNDHGVKVEVGDEGDMIVRRKGSYRYTSPEGEVIEVHYTADENGFRAEGDHLPKVVKA